MNQHETHRVQKLLSNYGYCSRRSAEKLISARRVKINDKIANIGDKATLTDKIYVDGIHIKPNQKNIYIALNKPTGYITAAKDKEFKTVLDLVKSKDRIFPVGRLDKNTSGLLLLTNDGEFTNQITHPKFEIDKQYYVTTVNSIKQRDIKKMEEGLLLKDFKTSPAKIDQLNPNSLNITIHEGKNRIIRRMFAKLGYEILTLKRIKIGALDLNTLNIDEGNWIELPWKNKKEALIAINGN